MNSIIEHIARWADIDTRRVMGFKPRKLPPSDFTFEYRPKFVEMSQGVSQWIKLTGGAYLYVCPDEISWVFGNGNFMTKRIYCFRRDGRVSTHSLDKHEHSVHPDFNEDGSFKRSRSEL